MTISQLLIGIFFFFAISTVLISKKVVPARGFAYGLVLVLAVGYGFILQADDKANGIVYSHWAESPAILLPMIAFGVGVVLWLLFKFVRPTIHIKEN
ncbi:MAG: hypothetical protein J5680_01240 [Neisseriaceae bacterium]|nr:hypothetical protein [Neisseriaceae bacterium]